MGTVGDGALTCLAVTASELIELLSESSEVDVWIALDRRWQMSASQHRIDDKLLRGMHAHFFPTGKR